MTQFSDVTYSGTFSGSGAGTDEGLSGTASITGPVTAVLSEDGSGHITGTFSYSGSSSLSNNIGSVGGPSFSGGGSVSGTQSGLTFTATSGPLNSGSATISGDDTTITFSDGWSFSGGGLSGSGSASGTLTGSPPSSPSPPSPPSPPPTPPGGVVIFGDTPAILEQSEPAIPSQATMQPLSTDANWYATPQISNNPPSIGTLLLNGNLAGLLQIVKDTVTDTAENLAIQVGIINEVPFADLTASVTDTQSVGQLMTNILTSGPTNFIQQGVLVSQGQESLADFNSNYSAFGNETQSEVNAEAADEVASQVPGAGWMFGPLMHAFFQESYIEQDSESSDTNVEPSYDASSQAENPIVAGSLLANTYTMNVTLDDTLSAGPGGGVILGGDQYNYITLGPGDTFAAGGGAGNLFTAGAGNDFLDGGTGGVNTLDFSVAPSGINVNLATGTAANGWGGTDNILNFQIINGSPFNDTFEAGPGSYTINGGGGLNTMVYTGPHSSYAVSHTGGSAVISDMSSGSPNGTDTLNGIDQLHFSYGVVDTAFDFAGGGASDLLLRNSSSGAFELYDIANNAITAAQSMGQVGLEWQIAGFGDFTGSGGTDMMMRNKNTGQFEVYDIANNAITSAAGMGQVGLEWQVAGFGDFTGSGLSDMLLRNVNTGAFEYYDIASNAITSAGGMGQVGLEWQVAGFGDFAGDGTSDMLMRNKNTGQFEFYDIANNQVVAAHGMGQVGLEWQVVGFGDFAGDGSSGMLMRNSNTGAFEVYDIADSQIVAAHGMGQVGLEWQVLEIGTFNGDFTGDMLMQDTRTGQLEVYDIANNAVVAAASMGQVGTEWAPAGSPNLPGVTTAQVTQAMAAFAPAVGTLETSTPPSAAMPQSSSNTILAVQQMPHASSA